MKGSDVLYLSCALLFVPVLIGSFWVHLLQLEGTVNRFLHARLYDHAGCGTAAAGSDGGIAAHIVRSGYAVENLAGGALGDFPDLALWQGNPEKRKTG